MSDQTVPGLLQWLGDAIEEIYRPMHNALFGFDIVYDQTVPRGGKAIVTPEALIMHPADAIAMKHPATLDGRFAAADEYLAWLIDRAAARSIDRIEAMYR